MPVSDDRERDPRAIGIYPGADADFTALGVLQRVRQQVAQDLRHLRFVGVQRRQHRSVLEHELAPID